jgi:hypothetical protein
MINTMQDLEGDVIEFGTGSARHSAIICANTQYSGKRFFTFDGFQGLPETEKGVPSKTGWEPGNLKFSHEEAVSILSQFHHAKVIKLMSWELTEPQDYEIEKVSSVNFDFDLYEGTLDGLRFVQKATWNSILFRFDDWGAYDFQVAEEVDKHEKAAFYDWINETNYQYEEYKELTNQSGGLQTIILVKR